MATSSSLQLLAIAAGDGAEVGRDCPWNFVGGLSGLSASFADLPPDAMLSLPSLQDFVKALQAVYHKKGCLGREVVKGHWDIRPPNTVFLTELCRCWILWSSTKQPASQFQKVDFWQISDVMIRCCRVQKPLSFPTALRDLSSRSTRKAGADSYILWCPFAS